jgi:hypothetical protein
MDYTQQATHGSHSYSYFTISLTTPLALDQIITLFSFNLSFILYYKLGYTPGFRSNDQLFLSFATTLALQMNTCYDFGYAPDSGSNDQYFLSLATPLSLDQLVSFFNA